MKDLKAAVMGKPVAHTDDEDDVNEELISDKVTPPDHQLPAYEDLTKELGLLEKELEEIKKKAEENWQQFLLSRADHENSKRRFVQELEKTKQYCIEKFITDLLPVSDTLQCATDDINKRLQNLIVEDEQVKSMLQAIGEGVNLTSKMLQDVLQKFGIKFLNPQGEAFNPTLHEAMGMQHHVEVPNGNIMQVIQPGFLLHERVVRPARVIVSKGPEN